MHEDPAWTIHITLFALLISIFIDQGLISLNL